MNQWQDGKKKWSMLSKRERRHALLSALKIPKYLRFYLADQTRDTDAKRMFHTEFEAVVRQSHHPISKDFMDIREHLPPRWIRPWLFLRYIFTRS